MQRPLVLQFGLSLSAEEYDRVVRLEISVKLLQFGLSLSAEEYVEPVSIH